jgi:2-C-methyl-D-erythritol 4-phosphate cytidylyltransferase
MKKYAVIVAGGSGSRMGTTTPKQFLELRGRPLLLYTVNTFLNAYRDLQIILVVAQGYVATGQDIIRSSDDPNRLRLVTGGESRFYSVKNGLQHIHEPSVVFVHDGVRCLVSTDLIHRCYTTTLEHGNAIPAIQPVDSIRIETAEGSKVVDRSKIKVIQTPQTFHSDLIKSAYEQEFDEAFTDEASVVERLRMKIHLVPGEETNIKITRPLDLLIAGHILEDRNLRHKV